MTTTALAMSELRSEWTGPRRVLPAVAVAGICVGAAFTPAGDDEGVVLCPYRIISGGAWCPGCGSSRAVRAMVRSDLGTAFTLNPWAMLILVQAVVLSSLIVAAPQRALGVWHAYKNPILVANAMFALVAWSLRMGFGIIPTPF